jgi:hypothetical protein
MLIVFYAAVLILLLQPAAPLLPREPLHRNGRWSMGIRAIERSVAPPPTKCCGYHTCFQALSVGKKRSGPESVVLFGG